MSVEAYEVYRSAGRLRLRIPSKKRDPAYFRKLVDHFTDFSGIEEFLVNPLTGTVLFIHSMEVDEIAGHAREHGLFSLASHSGVKQHDTIFEAASKTMATWNYQLKRSTGGSVDLPSLLFLGLVVSGFYQISKGNFKAPPWYTAFWYALGIFSKAAFDTIGESSDLGDDGGNGD